MDPEELEARQATRLEAPGLAALPGIRHQFASDLRAAPEGTWRPCQVHGAALVEPCGPGLQIEADGGVAGPGDPPVAVVTADCVPLLLARRDGVRVGAIHAGWRGCALGIVEAAVARVAGRAGPHALVAALGPAASEGYEVGAEVLDALAPRAERVRATRPGHALLDLRGHVLDRLLDAGLAPDAVELVGPCSVLSPDWPSYRREGDAAGRAVAWILAESRPR